MIRRRGFSLIEITVVMLIMGLTITALLQMFDWSQVRYGEISRGWQKRAALAEIRLWLRDRIIHSEYEQINVTNLAKAVRLPSNFRIAKVKLRAHSDNTWFITLDYFDDRNRNKKPDARESDTRLFCFRGRAA
ncbi:MAG: type II secretion system GspH family protein [Candidatus Riflebacteria bacterium]|nr:type II secretion system GspH family protein [Candidatus Riflebacteria bacterium]